MRLVQLQWESPNFSILAVNPQNDNKFGCYFSDWQKITGSGTKKLKITKPPNLAVNLQNDINLAVIPQSEKYLAVIPQGEKLFDC